MLRGGLSSDENPTINEPTVCTTIKNLHNNTNEVYYGYEAIERSDLGQFTSLINKGLITEWDNIV